MESEPSIEELLALKAQYARDSQALEASLVKKGAKGAWQRSHDLCLFYLFVSFFSVFRSSLIPPQRLTKIQCTDGRRLSELTHAEGVYVDAPDDLTECAQSLDNVALAAMIKERYG